MADLGPINEFVYPDTPSAMARFLQKSLEGLITFFGPLIPKRSIPPKLNGGLK